MVYYSSEIVSVIFEMFLGSVVTSTRREKKEARNLGEAHWNTKGKPLALYKASSSVVKLSSLENISEFVGMSYQTNLK